MSGEQQTDRFRGPSRKEVDQRRREELRRRLEHTRTVVVEQHDGVAPKGVRLEMVIDTETGTNQFNLMPHSAQGLKDFILAWQPIATTFGLEIEVREITKRDDRGQMPSTAVV